MKNGSMILAALAVAAMILACGCAEQPDQQQGSTVAPTSTPVPKQAPESDGADLESPASENSSVIITTPRPPSEEPLDINTVTRTYTSLCNGACTPEYGLRQVFSATYTMNYQSIGLLATITEEPLVIEFSTSPKHESPHRAFLIITVTDPETGEGIAEDGFNRVYSSESPKQMVIRKPGHYHINLYGALVDVDITILAGG
jgi:hypothetical protein